MGVRGMKYGRVGFTVGIKHPEAQLFSRSKGGGGGTWASWEMVFDGKELQNRASAPPLKKLANGVAGLFDR